MSLKKILILGAKGQVGWEARCHFSGFADVISMDFPQIDFSKPEALLESISSIKPDLIFNAVAYTAVDQAEENRDLVFQINAYTPEKIAGYCKKSHIPLIHFSSDYVFDGKKMEAYVETDQTNPLNLYGQAKLLGDQLISQNGCYHWIFRPSWVYSNREGGFLKKVIEWAKKNRTLKIVEDQVSNPTWCRALANATSILLSRDINQWEDLFERTSGLYHLAGWGSTSRFEWAKYILDFYPKKDELFVEELLPASSADFPTPAQRPLHSALNCEKFEKTFDLKLPDWQDAVRLVLDETG